MSVTEAQQAAAQQAAAQEELATHNEGVTAPASFQGTSKLQRATMRAATAAVAHAGPTLVRIKPLRKAIVRRMERWIDDLLEQQYADSPRPTGVCRDRAQIQRALLHTIERAAAEGRLAPTVVRNMIRTLGHQILIQRGERTAVDRFYAQYGERPPAFLVISPTKSCNLRCAGCYADSGAASEKLDWPIFDQIVTQAKELWGARFFVFTGGEPFVYRSQGKGILDLVEKHNDCFFLSYTNGTLIDDKVAERLAKAGNLTPAISVEGGRERTDDRRGEGVFDRILAAMGRLREAGVPFGVSLTATRHNTEELLSESFVDFAFEEQKAIYAWMFHYMPIGRSYTLDLMPTPEQRLWLWRRAWEVVRERQVFIGDFWNFGTTCDGCISAGRCDGGGYFHIDWNGAVTPCVFVPYSPRNINEAFAKGENLNDVWADPFFGGIRDWQADYRAGDNGDDGYTGNWLAPCIIRDHHDDFRRLLSEHEPDPTDENARDALMDAEYAQGMIDYGADYQAVSGKVWQQEYLDAPTSDK
jgi:MoaA/NifB/PqqE/SkfB family radical SAM enzyme